MPVRQDTLRERWLTQQHYATSTRRTYRETLSEFQRRHPVHAEQVRPEHLIDFLTTDVDGHETRRAPSTLSRQRSTLKAFWQWASDSGYVKVNPAQDLGRLMLGSGERRPGRWLTRPEANRLLEECVDGTPQGQRDHTLLLVAMLTGLRRTELASMRWRQLDLSQGRVSIVGKGSKLATIGLPEQSVAGLRAWRATVTTLQGHGPRPDDPVFATGRPQGGLHHSQVAYVFDWKRALSPWGVRAMIARRADMAGLGVVATHDLRRSFAGFLDGDGADLKDIQAALRHSSPDVTARCYLDRSPRRAVRATALLRL